MQKLCRNVQNNISLGHSIIAGPLNLHDNALPHIANVVTEKLHEYSPEMSPPAFELFKKLKEPMHGRRFLSVEEFSDAASRSIRQTKK